MKFTWLVVPTFVFVAVGLAQEESGAIPSQSLIPLQVLKTRKVILGNQLITLNRVAPPVFPEVSSTGTVTSDTTAENVALAPVQRPRKKSEILFLATTVYDHRVTELRWFNNLHEYKLFSNIDFNYLAGMGWFETEDTEYLVVAGIGNQTSEEVRAFNQRVHEQGLPEQLLKEIPDVGRFSGTRAEYFVVEDEGHPQPTAEGLAALDALHVYYDVHKQSLAEEYVLREAARIERERWLKDHPTAPKNIVINYWRKPSERP